MNLERKYWQENQSRFIKLNNLKIEAKKADKRSYYQINLMTQKLLKQFLEEEIERTIKRLKKISDEAYLLLIYGSAFLTFQPKQAWFFSTQLFSQYEEETLLLALFSLFNRYLLDTQEVLPGVEPFIKQHSLIRNVAFKHLVSTQRKEGNPNHE